MSSVFPVDSEHDAGRLVPFLEFKFCFRIKRRLKKLGGSLKLITYTQASKMNPFVSKIQCVFLIKWRNL